VPQPGERNTAGGCVIALTVVTLGWSREGGGTGRIVARNTLAPRAS
jgi:hypothetical protein